MTIEVINEYRFDRPDDWGPGPWVDEPDKVHWIDKATDLDCLMVRAYHGAWCGYVGIPPGHPHHGKEWKSLPYDINYGELCDEGEGDGGVCHVPLPGRPHDVYWVGFDCAHAFDLAPGNEAMFRKHGIDFPNEPGPFSRTYRTLSVVQGRVAGLAAEVKAAA